MRGFLTVSYTHLDVYKRQNHQSLIATKTSRIVHAAGGDGVMEFGLRRAQGPVSYTHLNTAL